MKELRREPPPRNAKVAPSRVGAVKGLSPVAQSVVDHIRKLDAAGKLRGKTIGLSIDDGASAIPIGDEQDFGFQPEAEVEGVQEPSRGKIGVYDESGDAEAEEGSMLADILRAVTRKVPTPPLRNSRGQIAVIRMPRGDDGEL